MHIYDDVYKTLLEKNSHLIIPVINEIFSTDYSMNEKISLLSGEHHISVGTDASNSDIAEIGGDRGGVGTDGRKGQSSGIAEIITDSCILIGDKLYHIECQSNPDGTMILRFIEYDFYIALEHAVRQDGSYVMEFPHSAVLYLRSTNATPDTLSMCIKFPNGESVSYEVPVLKTQTLTVEDILMKKLYFIVPYYIMRYEKTADRLGDAEKNVLMAEYQRLYDGVESAHSAGDISDYDVTNIIDLTNRLVDYTVDNEKVRKDVKSVMGGTVLETYADKKLKEGRKEGRREGRKEAMWVVAEILRGADNEYIACETGLTEEEINEIRMELAAAGKRE